MNTLSSPTLDPVALVKTPEDVTRLCDGQLAQARKIQDDIRSLREAPPDALTWEETLGALDRISRHLQNASSFPSLLAVAHPDEAVREAAKACDPKIDAFVTALYLDEDLSAIFKRYAEKKETLPANRAKFLRETLRDYRRNGLELDAAGRERLAALNKELTELGQKYEVNIASGRRSIRIRPEQLDGLPQNYKDAHPAEDDGLVTVTTDYPDYYPFMTYARDRQAARELYLAYSNRAAEQNLPILDRLLALRHEKAKLLGYATWADYVLEPRMAKTSGRVKSFLNDLRAFLAERGRREYEELHRAHVALGGKTDDVIFVSDHLYLDDRVCQTSYALDTQKQREYFEVSAVKEGILTITSKLFNLTYRRVDAPAWHEDVEAYDVLDASGELLGRFYLDLYPRDDKYKHAAVFPLRGTERLADGKRLTPIAAMVCNFPKPGTTPALLSHGEVTTFFHEFGHVLHSMLSATELVSQSGTSVANDFVEAPSQMLEEWAWSRETLGLFARHFETGEPMPDDMFAAMSRARHFGKALFTLRQIFLATLDFTYHTREPGFDTTAVMEELHREIFPLAFVPGSHFQASFGHLVGYDAGYYGYQWALSIAKDLLTRFEEKGLLDQGVAAEYRAAILSQGGSAEEDDMIKAFLGRPTNDEAYKRFLSL